MMQQSDSDQSERKRAFDRLTGGAIPEILPLPQSIWVNILRRQTRTMVKELRERRPNVFQDIHVDIVDELCLNALACQDDTGEYIGLNVGLALSIPQIMFHLLGQPQLFPSIGDPSMEKPTIVQVADRILSQDGSISRLDPQRVDWMCPFDYPRDPVRERFAGYLLTTTWGFLTYHEISHLVRCHIDFLRESKSGAGADVSVLHEFDAGVTEEEASIRRILELDADAVAAQNMLAAVIHNGLATAAKAIFENDPVRQQTWGWADLCYTMHIAMGMLFEIMACLDAREIDDPRRTHPHPDVRRNLILNLSWRTWKQYIPDQSQFIEVCRKAAQDFSEVTRLGVLPSSRARHAARHGRARPDLESLWKTVGEVDDRLTPLVERRQARYCGLRQC